MAMSGISPLLAAGQAAQATGAAGDASQGSGSTGMGGLSSTDFLSLFVAQLQNQDPLNPTDTNQFLTQTAQLSQVEGINQMNQSLTQLLSAQQLTQGAGLIGKKVTYQLSGADTPQTGVVSGVSLVNGQAELTVGSGSVPLSQVQSITAA
jgi:flagellar basal-body rod modification protein FlgD